MDKFICCQETPHFERIKNGYKCVDCEKVYLDKTIHYEDKVIEFSKLKYNLKLRGRKADFIRNENGIIFSTLQKGRVEIIYMNNAYEILNKKIFQVKKNVLEHKLNKNGTLLTITQNSVVNVYDIETEKIITEQKLDIKCAAYKIQIFSLEKDGKWLVIDTEKISVYSNDFTYQELILSFKDEFLCQEILKVSSVDCFPRNESFVVHINYKTPYNQDMIIKSASIYLKNLNQGFEIDKYCHDDVMVEYTYDFHQNFFFGTRYDRFLLVDENYMVQNEIQIPYIKKYSDGGGIFWLEEFIIYPKKSYLLRDNILVLYYLQDLIVLDITNGTVLYDFDGKGNIIQSLFSIDEATICFSAGLNTYIVKI